MPASDASSPTSDAPTSFRFLDLLPELRNRIYSIALQTHKSRDISCYRTPRVTLVSKQVRQETLPLFYSSNFRVLVGCNFARAVNQRTGHELHSEPFKYSTGTLPVSDEVKAILRFAGKRALFRNVTIEVYNADIIHEIRDWQKQGGLDAVGEMRDPRFPFVLVHLRVRDSKIEVKMEQGKEYPSRASRTYCMKLQPQDVDAVEKAVGIARNIAGPGAFQGFKLSDLRKVALGFRIE